MTNEIEIPATIKNTSSLQKILDESEDTPTKYIFGSSEIKIDVPLRLYNFTEFAGAGIGLTKFKLIDNAPIKLFYSGVPLIGSQYSIGTEDLVLHDFSINGNYLKQITTIGDHGYGNGNQIGIGNIQNPNYENSKDCSFYRLELGYSEGDGIRVEGGRNIKIHDIKSSLGGHDVVCLAAVDGGEVYNLDAKMRSNAAIRTRSAKNIKIHDCSITGTSLAYSPGIEIQSTAVNWTSSNIEIYNNHICDTYGPGVQVASNVPGNGPIKIHHNVIENCGLMPAENNLPVVGGIVIDGFPVEVYNNNILDCYGYSVVFGAYDVLSTYRNTSKVYRNIILRTQLANTRGIYTGTGIANLTGSRNTIQVSENCQYGNKRANHYQVTYTGSISGDPLFVSDLDMHLQSKSPCLKNGYYIGAFDKAIPPKVYFLQVTRKTREERQVLAQAMIDMDLVTAEEVVYGEKEANM
jgi:hypothetical protein